MGNGAQRTGLAAAGHALPQLSSSGAPLPAPPDPALHLRPTLAQHRHADWGVCEEVAWTLSRLASGLLLSAPRRLQRTPLPPRSPPQTEECVRGVARTMLALGRLGGGLSRFFLLTEAPVPAEVLESLGLRCGTGSTGPVASTASLLALPQCCAWHAGFTDYIQAMSHGNRAAR